MRYYALATDYDGTLAHDGTVDRDTIKVLQHLRDSGRKIILVTGRELDDLLRVFDRMDLIAYAVLENGALLYKPDTRETRYPGEPPFRFKSYLPSAEHGRHRQKYAKGELDRESSFFFRGPENKLRLRADNLFRFVEIAEGVDDETWTYHLRQGDYSRWFRDTIRDKVLAEETVKIEQTRDITPEDSRLQIRNLIEERYSAPA